MKQKLMILLVLCSIGWSTTAFAQEEEDDTTSVAVAAVLLTTSSMFGFSLAYIPTAQKMDERKIKGDMEELKQFVLLRQYLNHNQSKTQMAITVGGGTTLRELAQIAGVRTEDVAHWGRWVRANRKSLMHALSSPKLDRRARVFQAVLRTYHHQTVQVGGRYATK